MSTAATIVQLRPDPASEPSARRQFKRRRRLGPTLNPNPRLSAEIRDKYLAPLVPWTMYAIDLAPTAGVVFGLVSILDMLGYAAHCETGVPYYATQGPWLRHLTPARKTDPLHYDEHAPFRRRTGSSMVPRDKRLAPRNLTPRPLIALVDRFQLRAKYEDIARRYLTGDFRGFGRRSVA